MTTVDEASSTGAQGQRLATAMAVILIAYFGLSVAQYLLGAAYLSDVLLTEDFDKYLTSLFGLAALQSVIWQAFGGLAIGFAVIPYGRKRSLLVLFAALFLTYASFIIWVVLAARIANNMIEFLELVSTQPFTNSTVFMFLGFGISALAFLSAGGPRLLAVIALSLGAIVAIYFSELFINLWAGGIAVCGVIVAVRARNLPRQAMPWLVLGSVSAFLPFAMNIVPVLVEALSYESPTLRGQRLSSGVFHAGFDRTLGSVAAIVMVFLLISRKLITGEKLTSVMAVLLILEFISLGLERRWLAFLAPWDWLTIGVLNNAVLAAVAAFLAVRVYHQLSRPSSG